MYIEMKTFYEVKRKAKSETVYVSKWHYIICELTFTIQLNTMTRMKWTYLILLFKKIFCCQLVNWVTAFSEYPLVYSCSLYCWDIYNKRLVGNTLEELFLFCWNATILKFDKFYCETYLVNLFERFQVEEYFV